MSRIITEQEIANKKSENYRMCLNTTHHLQDLEQRRRLWISCMNSAENDISVEDYHLCMLMKDVKTCKFTYVPKYLPGNASYGSYRP